MKLTPSETIMKLESRDIDCLGLSVYLEKRIISKKGRKPRNTRNPRQQPDNPFAYTRQFLETYAKDADATEVLIIFEGQNLHSDSDVLRFLLVNEASIPERED